MKSVARFVEKVYGLSHVRRWNFQPTLRNENVAEHSFYVALFTMILSQGLESQQALTIAALLHDTEESVTADLPALVKKHLGNVWQDFVVTRAEKELIGAGDDTFFASYEKARALAEHSVIIKIADLFSALMYSREELRKGNTYFVRIERELIQSVVDAAKKCEDYAIAVRAMYLLQALGFDPANGLPRPSEMSHL